MAITIRPANVDDAPDLFRWRNDVATRLASRNSGELRYHDHLAWLERTLADSARQLFIAELDGRAIGTIRADTSTSGDYTVLSWTIAPECRGLGYGKQILTAYVKTAEGTLRADIRPENQPSRRMVESLGFIPGDSREGFTSWFLTR